MAGATFSIPLTGVGFVPMGPPHDFRDRVAADGRRVFHPDDDELGHDQEGVGQRQVGDEQEGRLVRAATAKD